MPWIRTRSAPAAPVAASALVAVLIATSGWAQWNDESSSPVYERMNDGRAALGIWFHSLPEGAHVVRVVSGSPAERAGLEPGDFITRINGKPCDDWQVVTRQIAGAEPQSILQLEVSRSGLTIRLETELGGHYEVFSDRDETWSDLAAPAGNQNNGQRTSAPPDGQ